jgi:hypothetical protein
VEWGPLPGPAMLQRRTAAALAKARRPVPLKPAEVDEVRIVANWVASHMPEELPLDDGADVVGFVKAATGEKAAAPVSSRELATA